MNKWIISMIFVRKIFYKIFPCVIYVSPYYIRFKLPINQVLGTYKSSIHFCIDVSLYESI